MNEFCAASDEWVVGTSEEDAERVSVQCELRPYHSGAHRDGSVTWTEEDAA